MTISSPELVHSVLELVHHVERWTVCYNNSRYNVNPLTLLAQTVLRCLSRVHLSKTSRPTLLLLLSMHVSHDQWRRYVFAVFSFLPIPTKSFPFPWKYITNSHFHGNPTGPMGIPDLDSSLVDRMPGKNSGKVLPQCFAYGRVSWQDN